MGVSTLDLCEQNIAIDNKKKSAYEQFRYGSFLVQVCFTTYTNLWYLVIIFNCQGKNIANTLKL